MPKAQAIQLQKFYVQNYHQWIGYGTRNVKSYDVLIENLFESEVLNVYDYTVKCKMFDHFFWYKQMQIDGG